MERLTQRTKFMVNDELAVPMDMSRSGMVAIVNRLAAYEDTGLEPEEIEKMGMAWADSKRYSGRLEGKLRAYEALGSISRLRELAQAKKEGRLVVLPCKVGDTVFAIGKRRVVECYINEAYLYDAKGVEYLVSFDCNDDCNGCPFNSWHQDVSGEYSCDGEYEEASIMGADFGKTVFLTYEEAEAALKGGGGNL